MSRCSPDCARVRNVVPVLEAAAVIGRQMDRGLLCAVVDLSDEEVDNVIDELDDALVLERWGTDDWRFRHELLREVAAELAPPSVRTSGCMPRWPTPSSEVRAAILTGGWWPPTTSGPSESTRRPRRTGGHRRMHGAAGRWREARTYLTQALGQLEPCDTRPDLRPPRDGHAVGTGIPHHGCRRPAKPRGRRRLRAVPAAGWH